MTAQLRDLTAVLGEPHARRITAIWPCGCVASQEREHEPYIWLNCPRHRQDYVAVPEPPPEGIEPAVAVARDEEIALLSTHRPVHAWMLPRVPVAAVPRNAAPDRPPVGRNVPPEVVAATRASDSSGAALRSQMPRKNTQVTLSRKRGATASGAIAALDPNTFTIRTPLAGQVDATYLIDFATAVGAFRMTARCLKADPDYLVFAYPAKIQSISAPPSRAASQRQSVRLETAMRVKWQLSHRGQQTGSYASGTLVDISRSGASLIANSGLPVGAELSIYLTLSGRTEPLRVSAEVRRVERTAQNRFLHGIQFTALSHDEERAIVSHINVRQAERRHRGLHRAS